MLRMWSRGSSESLSAAEQVAIDRLIATRARLPMDGDRMDTKSEEGGIACAAYLEALDLLATTLRLEKAPRSYRERFTINYRALFPDQARNYRVDVLEAGFEQHSAIWVNGDKFEFSAEAMRRAELLQQAWWSLGTVLDRWAQTSRGQRASRAELRSAMVALDYAWANFEHKYISELIEIEEKARRLIIDAIEHERSVTAFEEEYRAEMLNTIGEYVEAQRLLVGSIGRLNSVANVRRKGRDDLRVDVFFDAMKTLHRCDVAERGGESTERLIAARILATDVVESFQGIRDYLREVCHCLERADPHLCNNAGLVARLTDWEESWELGTRYMQNEKLLSGVCDLVAEIRHAQRVAPALTTMCDECDVELFLVLPRMIWLRFLAQPHQHTELLRSLLPHRFPKEDEVKGNLAFKERGEAEEATWDADVEAFLQRYRATQDLLLTGRCGKGAWEVLVKHIVNGSISSKDDNLDKAAKESVEDLHRSLERWSMELQRHCPEDWNQCCAILVQCLTKDTKKSKPVPFQV
mmetsp:Transcript_93984/g.271683  ORF Transcript_93984/g.271683 Transcript_93984/m.271683 type:complete len:524 (-) Transcript_93984:315-1886(-)